MAETTVESVNDGKVAAWQMHRYLQKLHGIEVSEEPKLPMFTTPIDEVGIWIEMGQGMGHKKRERGLQTILGLDGKMNTISRFPGVLQRSKYALKRFLD